MGLSRCGISRQSQRQERNSSAFFLIRKGAIETMQHEAACTMAIVTVNV